MSYVMGIDIGTYESKGVVVDSNGNVLVQAAVPHRLEIPKQGWAEHDAETTWWHDFKRLSSDLLEEARVKFGIRPEEVKAVGVSTIAPAVVPIDINGKPLRKAILYGIDLRADKEISELNETMGKEVMFEIAGQVLSSQAAGPKILWIRHHEPEVYERTHKFLCGSGYLVYKLTGECVIDRYTAVNYAPLFDIRSLEWNQDTVTRITEPSKLPQLAWSCEIVGTVTGAAAEETGLSPGTKVIAGTADAMAEAISIGAVHHGDLMMMYGSSTFFILMTDSMMSTNRLWPNVHVVPGQHTLTGGTSTAGSLTRWFVDQWLVDTQNNRNGMTIDQAYTYLARLAEHSPQGANGLITLPYFSGERTPIHDSAAKGIMFGLSLNHTTADMYRSLLEGIAFSIRHNLEVMWELGAPIERIIAVGGGVKNRLWLQCVSDICQVRQYVPEVTIGACYGNAYICAMALGWHGELREIDEWVKMGYEIEPQSDHKELYERQYDVYRRLYEHTKQFMK